MTAGPKKLLIIDSNALIHRAYHALPPLKTKKGELVNAVYGFCLVFLKAIRELRPDFVAAAFDLPGPTFRHKEFKEYKAKRVKAPDELYQQIDGVKRVLRAFNVPVFEKQGFEADDLIGTIACSAANQQVLPKIESIILSGDLDTLQLVGPQTKVYTMRRGIKDTVLYDAEKVKERYGGLEPSQLLDFKALRGDVSDNIPGVSGIGEKTAIQLLQDFGSLDKLYDEIEKPSFDIAKAKEKNIKKSVLEKLKQYKEQALLSKRLAEIQCDVPIGFKLKNCEFRSPDKKEIIKTFQGFEFYALLNRLPGLKPGSDLALALKQKDKVEQEIDKLQEQGVLSAKIVKIEKSLVPIVEKMNQYGIKIDERCLKNLSTGLGQKITALEKKIYKLAGTDFNLNSPQQLAEILFSKLHLSLEGLKKTPGGAVSTGAAELAKLKEGHPIVGLILQYRKIFKLKSGFVDALPKMVSPKDGRIHPHFHQLGTETGRMSCSEPNLQNIPIKGELGREIRKCFVPDKGFQFVSADYSQMELRIAASIAEDRKMLGFFKEGKDIHTMTATEIFGVPEKKVTKEQRRLAKTLNFGVLYGMGPHSFSERTGVSFKQAQEFIKKYFEDFKGIAEYTEESVASIKEEGFSETLFGRKRFLPEINSRDARLRAAAERMARNFPIQGTAADIMKMAMVKIDSEMRKTFGEALRQNVRMILQVHDELLFEVKADKTKEVSSKIKEIMENIVKLKASLRVDLSQGKNWGDLEML